MHISQNLPQAMPQDTLQPATANNTPVSIHSAQQLARRCQLHPANQKASMSTHLHQLPTGQTQLAHSSDTCYPSVSGRPLASLCREGCLLRAPLSRTAPGIAEAASGRRPCNLAPAPLGHLYIQPAPGETNEGQLAGLGEPMSLAQQATHLVHAPWPPAENIT